MRSEVQTKNKVRDMKVKITSRDITIIDGETNVTVPRSLFRALFRATLESRTIREGETRETELREVPSESESCTC